MLTDYSWRYKGNQRFDASSGGELEVASGLRQVGSNPVFSTIVRFGGHPTGMMNWTQYLKSTRSFHWSLGQGARSAAIEHLIVGRSFEGYRVGSGERDIRKPQSLIAVSRVVALYLHVDA